MAQGKRAQTGTVIPRDFSEALAAAERKPAAEFDPGAVGQDEFSDDLALANTLAQIGESEGDAKVYVYKIDKVSKAEAFAFETTPAEFATGGLSEIGKRYGGGDYRIRVYSDGRILTHKRVSILESKESAAVPSQNIAADLQGLMAQQTATMMEGFKMIAETLRSNQPSAPQPPSFIEQAQAFATLQNLFGPRQQSGPDFGQVLDVLKQGMELGRSGGEQSMLDVLMRGIETFGPVLTDAVKNGAANQQAQIPVQVQAPQTAMISGPQPLAAPGTVAVPVPPIETQTSEDEMGMLRNAMLKQAINFLTNQAIAGNDPETYANMVLDQMGDDEARAFIARPDWLDFLATFDARVKQPAAVEWYGELRDAINEYLTAEPESGTSAPHAPTGNAESASVAVDGNTKREGGNS